MDLRHETKSPQRSHHMDPRRHRTPTRNRHLETQRHNANPMHHRMGPTTRRPTTTHHHRIPPQHRTTRTSRSHDQLLPKNKRSDHRRKKKILAAATQGTTNEDLAICAAMGWTADMLHAQPARFIERLVLYLDASARERERMNRRNMEQLRRLGIKP